MIRRILLPLDPSRFSESAMNMAFNIATVYDADVVGLVVLDISGIHKSIGPVPLGASYYARELETSRRGR